MFNKVILMTYSFLFWRSFGFCVLPRRPNGHFKDEGEIRSEVRREAKLGVDYIKVYGVFSTRDSRNH